uniref:C2 domain-containing protein n=1 Tax=Heterorhabditis bacteriophora TaxID=37862 RepID=A0A1I7XHF5_HETBA
MEKKAIGLGQYFPDWDECYLIARTQGQPTKRNLEFDCSYTYEEILIFDSDTYSSGDILI